MKIRCIVIDHEREAREILKTQISKTPLLEFVAEFKSPLQAIESILSQNIGLVFLAVHTPEISGLDFLQAYTFNAKVILTSTDRNYALEGFDLGVLDYLLKPIGFPRFLKAINKLHTAQPYTTPSITKLKIPSVDPIIIKSDKKIYRLAPSEIIYIEGLLEYVQFHTTNYGRLVVYASIKKLIKELPKTNFLRIHRSFIINTSYAKMLDGNLLQITNRNIPVSTTYRAGLMKLFRRSSC